MGSAAENDDWQMMTLLHAHGQRPQVNRLRLAAGQPAKRYLQRRGTEILGRHGLRGAPLWAGAAASGA
jgi:hypothetical protein